MTSTASSSAPLSSSDEEWSPPPTACPSTLDPTEKRPTPPWAAPALTEAADLVGMPGLAGRRVEILAGPSSTLAGLVSATTPPRFVSSSIGTDDRVAVRLLDGPAVVTVEVSAGSPARFVSEEAPPVVEARPAEVYRGDGAFGPVDLAPAEARTRSTWTTMRVSDLGRVATTSTLVRVFDRSGFVSSLSDDRGGRIALGLASSPGGAPVVMLGLDPSDAVEVAR